MQPLWERYYRDIVRLARKRYPQARCGDSEVLAESAFRSFWEGVRAGRFPRLNDRHDLWKLLVFITKQKIWDARNRKKTIEDRAGWTNHGDGLLESLIGREPSPEFAQTVFEQLQRLLNLLPDETLRDIAVWKLEGETNKAIAERLGCALKTVSNKLDLIRAIFKRDAESK